MTSERGRVHWTRVLVVMWVTSTLPRCDGGCGDSATGAVKDASSEAAPSIVEVTLDGRAVAALGRDELKTRIVVGDLLRGDAGAQARARSLTARAPGGRTLVVDSLDEKYKDMDLVLYWDESYGATLGLFRRIEESMPANVKAALAAPHMRLVAVTNLELRSVAPSAPSAAGVTLSVVVDRKPARSITADDVDDLSVVVATDAGSRERERRNGGHPLSEVVSLFVAVERVRRVIATGPTRADDLVIDGDDLRKGTSTPLLRLTPRGQWDLRLRAELDSGVEARLRDVRSLEIETGPAP